MNIILPSIRKNEEPSKHQMLEKGKKIYDYFSTRIPRSHVEMILRTVKDDRFSFFIQFGALRRYDGDCEVIYVEIPQIPKKLVVYRLPSVRKKSLEKFNLSKKDLPQIPLFEGEENLKCLSLEMNLITKIDQLVSLNSLVYLNLYSNRISEIENLQNTPKLKVLLLGKNKIEYIRNLNFLQDLEVLDLHSNKIKIIENLSHLRKLRILNLANNQITFFSDLVYNKELEELNIRKNLIGTIPNLTNAWEKLKKLNLAKNLISNPDFLAELMKLKSLSEVIIEDNPVSFVKKAMNYLSKLPIYSPLSSYYLRQSQAQSKAYAQTQNTVPTKKINILAKSQVIPVNPLTLTSKNQGNSKEKIPTSEVRIPTLDIKIQKGELNEVQSQKKIMPIKTIWEEEYNKIIKTGFNGYVLKKYKELNASPGHIEIDGDTNLIIYGDGLKILSHEDFQKKITSISFNFYYYDTICNRKNIEYLKKFKKLSTIIFNHNNLHSFYQLLKLENIISLENLTISNNEILNCSLLKYFLIYRIHDLKIFNNQTITEEETSKSKDYFEYFDRCISNNEKIREEKEENEEEKQEEKTEEIAKRDIKGTEIKQQMNLLDFVKKNLDIVLRETLNEINEQE